MSALEHPSQAYVLTRISPPGRHIARTHFVQPASGLRNGVIRSNVTKLRVEMGLSKGTSRRGDKGQQALEEVALSLFVHRRGGG